MRVQKVFAVSRMGNGRSGAESEERTYVFMIDQLHELELSVGPLRMRHVLERSGQLLDRHILRSDGIVRRAATETERELKIRSILHARPRDFIKLNTSNSRKLKLELLRRLKIFI